jgi:hypothetical protein
VSVYHYGLIEELPTAAAGTVNQWYGALAEPSRRKGLAAAVVAAGCFWSGFTPQITTDRWHQAFSEPQRAKRGLPVNEQQSAAFVPLPTHIPGWQFETTQPTRRKGLATAQQQAIAFIGASPFAETVSADRWHQGTSQPTLRKRIVYPDGASNSSYIVPSTETVTVDKWFYEFSSPVRSRLGLPVREQQSVAFIGASPFAETVSVDRWAYSTAQPTRLLHSNARTGHQLFYLNQPTAFSGDLRSSAIYISSPWRSRIPEGNGSIGQADRQHHAYFYRGILAGAPVSETVTADKWYQALSEPQRSRVGLPVREQQSIAFVKASPFAETVTADRFVFELSQPVRQRRVNVGPQNFYPYFPIVTTVVIPPPDYTITGYGSGYTVKGKSDGYAIRTYTYGYKIETS